MRLTTAEWQTAQHVCTTRQLQALDLWRRGAGYGRIAHLLSIDKSTAREHIRRALNRIEAHLEHAA